MAYDRAQILITAVDQTRTAFASVKANLEGLTAAANGPQLWSSHRCLEPRTEQ